MANLDLIFLAHHKRNFLLAASMAFAAVLGAMIGVLASGELSDKTARTDVAGLEARQTMQQSIAQLMQEVALLKTSLETANRAAHNKIVQTGEGLKQDGAEITGSIAAPASIAPSSSIAMPVNLAGPMPRPRPPRRLSAKSLAHPVLVQDWSIREVHDGFVYVEGVGSTFQVVQGVSLPGLGIVEQIKRRNGRWVVITSKGMIVSMRDRPYFESL